MKKYKAQKLVEQLYINLIMYKDIKYEVVEHSTKNTYIVHNLKANIEDGVVWFSDERLDFMIESIEDININGNNIDIAFTDGSGMSISFIK